MDKNVVLVAAMGKVDFGRGGKAALTSQLTHENSLSILLFLIMKPNQTISVYNRNYAVVLHKYVEL